MSCYIRMNRKTIALIYTSKRKITLQYTFLANFSHGNFSVLLHWVNIGYKTGFLVAKCNHFFFFLNGYLILEYKAFFLSFDSPSIVCITMYSNSSHWLSNGFNMVNEKYSQRPVKYITSIAFLLFLVHSKFKLFTSRGLFGLLATIVLIQYTIT